MDIVIKATDEEKQAVIAAIVALNSLSHVRVMSQAMIANSAGMKTTKVRGILQELINEKKIAQYRATDNPRVQRYYYCIIAEPEMDTDCAEKEK